jgi:triacylglycerol esterase/lipase EstA (alpha/beta hydrolase family)
VYEAFGTTHFNSIKRLYQNIHFLPIINNLDESIEQRAQKISKKLPNLLQRLNAEQAHLISYSVSGLDTRFALSCLNMGQHCKTLTTIATPHKGSKTANFSERDFFPKTQI